MKSRHAIGQPDPAVLDQLHHARRRRHDLGERREVEDRVERHRLGRRLDGAAGRSPSGTRRGRRGRRARPRPAASSPRWPARRAAESRRAARASIPACPVRPVAGSPPRDAWFRRLVPCRDAANPDARQIQGATADRATSEAFASHSAGLYFLRAPPFHNRRGGTRGRRHTRSGQCPRARARSSFDRRPTRTSSSITIDTLRADALSSYGWGAARTPNLDGLAARGTRFDFAHAHAVLTRPSHASILTGTYPYENGVRDHSGYRLKAGLPTIASMLKEQGVRDRRVRRRRAARAARSGSTAGSTSTTTASAAPATTRTSRWPSARPARSSTPR